MENTPLDSLVFSAREFFETVAVPAADASVRAPGDRSKALAACILMFHVADWAEKEGLASEADFLASCPFGWTLKEIALGAKHRTVRNSEVRTADSMTALSSRAFGQGDYGQGPFGPALQTAARRLPGDDLLWTHTGEILTEVDAWWRNRLCSPPRPYII